MISRADGRHFGVSELTQECFNGSQTLYFLLEAALGGELYATYNRKGLHGSPPQPFAAHQRCSMCPAAAGIMSHSEIPVSRKPKKIHVAVASAR